MILYHHIVMFRISAMHMWRVNDVNNNNYAEHVDPFLKWLLLIKQSEL